MFFYLYRKHHHIQAVSSHMTSIDQQLRDFRAFAQVHSQAIDEELKSGRCIFSHQYHLSVTDPDDYIILADIYETVCLRPLHNRHASDPCDIKLLSVWLTPSSAIAFCAITWPDGVAFDFAATLQKERNGLYSFNHSFPYTSSEK